MKGFMQYGLSVIAAYAFVCLLGSMARVDHFFGKGGRCGEDYYIDYVVFSKLFCPIEATHDH